MNTKYALKSILKVITLTAITTAIVAADAAAQDLASIAAANMNFDNQMNSYLQNQQAQLNQQRASMVQNYIAQNGARLQQDYQRSGMQVPFDQFVQWHIMTAGGTNYGPAIQAQQNQFAGWQAANRTVQEGYNSYNQGYWQNQNTYDNSAARYSNEAIQGNAHYTNGQTGEVFNLPYGAEQGVYSQGNNTFSNDANGNYYQVNPQGYQQQLDLDDGE